MSECRILFAKSGKARYISHLDLMRTMQRAFIRAGIPLKHSEGFNPHPYLTFALPLSVGFESGCELMDTILLEDLPLEEIPARLNAAMPEGVTVLEAYVPRRKFKELVWLDTLTVMEYDGGVPADAEDAIAALFAQKTLMINKRTKSGWSDADIAPCIYKLTTTGAGEKSVLLRARLTAQNPALNPENLVSAIRQHLPEYTPDFAVHRRIEVFDGKFEVFR